MVFYQEIFEGFWPLVRTTDIDFYIPDVKKASPRGDVIAALKKLNYDHLIDALSNKSKFISPEGFEIEFLTKLNRRGLSSVTIGNTGINAESLSYVELFGDHFIELKRNGLSIKVASPSTFVIQKLLINERRGNKAEKDIQAIRYVLSFISLSKKHTGDFLLIWDGLPKKWKKTIEQVAQTHTLSLPI